jgi:hypothetical protein
MLCRKTFPTPQLSWELRTKGSFTLSVPSTPSYYSWKRRPRRTALHKLKHTTSYGIRPRKISSQSGLPESFLDVSVLWIQIQSLEKGFRSASVILTWARIRPWIWTCSFRISPQASGRPFPDGSILLPTQASSWCRSGHPRVPPRLSQAAANICVGLRNSIVLILGLVITMSLLGCLYSSTKLGD